VTAVYDHALAQCGLKVTQFSVLSNLLVLQAPTLSVLAEAMDMERTTLTRNLRPLIAAGWITVKPGANARRHEARLTAAGRAKWSEAKPLWRLAQNALNSALGDVEVARLHRMVDRNLVRLRGPVHAQ
jgi:DNA-binding MarR family transcriptional regulator